MEISTRPFSALYTHSSGWLEPAEASENQFNLV